MVSVTAIMVGKTVTMKMTIRVRTVVMIMMTMIMISVKVMIKIIGSLSNYDDDHNDDFK